MMFYLYGPADAAPIATTPTGRPRFADHQLPDFSLAYASNTVGVLLSDEGQSRVGYRSDAGARHPAKRAATRASDAGGKCTIGAQDDRLEARDSAVEHSAKRAEISGLGNSGQSTLRLHPFSGHLRSSATPDVQVMSDADEYLSWACAGSPGLDRLLCWRYEERGGLQKDGKSRRAARRRPHASLN
ncbi:hypothetical protein M8494_32570 [Serratia ureilytica]